MSKTDEAEAPLELSHVVLNEFPMLLGELDQLETTGQLSDQLSLVAMLEPLESGEFAALARGYDPKADAFSPDAKARYVRADATYFAATGQHMTIHSGRRTVRHQARLYVRYKYHNEGNRASWPGCSFHNWGVAADMVRTNEAKLVEAMSAHGWHRTVGDEGWHFECTASAEHSTAASTIASLRVARTGKAWLWSEQVALFYQKARDFERRAPVFNRRLEAWQADGQQLQAAIDSFNQQVQALRERTQRFNRDVQHYNSELQRARRMVDEINSMPPGPARDRKIREFRQLEGWLASESRRLDSESGAIDAEDRRLTRESAVLDQRIRAWKTEETWLNQEHASLTQLQQQIDGHSSTAEGLLTEIERAVP